MEYECCFSSDLNAIEVCTRGKADMTTLMEMLHRIADLCGREESANILVDHSALDARLLTVNDIEILSRESAAKKKEFKNRRCAHVVAKEYQLGLVRAWEIMAELKGFTAVETRTFKSREEAVAWITAIVQPGPGLGPA